MKRRTFVGAAAATAAAAVLPATGWAESPTETIFPSVTTTPLAGKPKIGAEFAVGAWVKTETISEALSEVSDCNKMAMRRLEVDRGVILGPPTTEVSRRECGEWFVERSAVVVGYA